MNGALAAIVYGSKEVTHTAVSKCSYNGNLYLPGGDHSRSEMFGDPNPNEAKKIKVIYGTEYVFSADKDIILTPDGPVDPEEKLKQLHASLQFVGGSLKDEYPEQVMSVMFIPKDARILELGANIGRNTLIMASLLDSGRIVTTECDRDTCQTLRKNIELNGLNVQVEEAALSKRRLFQVGWNTYTEETAPKEACEVKTVQFHDLEKKYDIQFDTIVADCEGALYYILTDQPNILDNIQLIIMENDYHDLSHKQTVDSVLVDKGFVRVYSKVGGWGPCWRNFYEVWTKHQSSERSLSFNLIANDHPVTSEICESLARLLESFGCSVHRNLERDHEAFDRCHHIVVDRTSPPYPIQYTLLECDQPGWSDPHRLKVLTNASRIWYFSQQGLSKLRSINPNAIYLPFVHYPESVLTLPQKEIDVCLLGYPHPRRDVVVERLKADGLNVYYSYSCWGQLKADVLAKSKIVLNLHYYSESYQEFMRVLEGLSSGCVVVCEQSCDQKNDEMLSCEWVQMVPYDLEIIVQAIKDRLAHLPEPSNITNCDLLKQYRTRLEASVKAELQNYYGLR